MLNRILLGGAGLSCLLALSGSSTVSLTPTKDNTLIEPDTLGVRSDGAGPQFRAGRIGGFGGGVGLRRGLLAFDVASSIPAGATITSASLDVYCSRVPLTDNGTPRTHSLQRATSDWGEGTSDGGINGGVGAPPSAGDATWNDAFFPGTPWGSVGGDFSATVSSSVSVPTTGPFTFPSSAQLVADVQNMLDNPGGDFGWAVIGDEVGASVARAFDSREAPTYPLYLGTAPVLTVCYSTPAPVPALPRWGKLTAVVLLAGAGLALLRRR